MVKILTFHSCFLTTAAYRVWGLSGLNWVESEYELVEKAIQLRSGDIC